MGWAYAPRSTRLHGSTSGAGWWQPDADDLHSAWRAGPPGSATWTPTSSSRSTLSRRCRCAVHVTALEVHGRGKVPAVVGEPVFVLPGTSTTPTVAVHVRVVAVDVAVVDGLRGLAASLSGRRSSAGASLQRSGAGHFMTPMTSPRLCRAGDLGTAGDCHRVGGLAVAPTGPKAATSRSGSSRRAREVDRSHVNSVWLRRRRAP